MKKTMTRQQFARQRNWNLARIVGFVLDIDVMTEEEISAYRKIKHDLRIMLSNYDKNSISLGIELKPYKCDRCGKRSNKQYVYEGVNFCRRHFNEATNTTSG